MTIFTIGYEGLDIDQFLSSLREHDIETVIDVREMPISRKPGFSKKALERTLSMNEREYRHLVALGCPKSIRDDYRADGNWKRYTERFQKYLATQSDAIAALSTLAKSSRCALLCYEADFNFCHRSMVASAVKQFAGMRVRHIQAGVSKGASVARLRGAFA